MNKIEAYKRILNNLYLTILITIIQYLNVLKLSYNLELFLVDKKELKQLLEQY